MDAVITITRRGGTTRVLMNGAMVAHVYSNKGHWYAADAEGMDLDGGWRLDTREQAERVAHDYARNA